MRKNFDMDAAIRRALRESIEAHAREWEPKFETGVGPVGDDAPFDNNVNEGCDKEEACCPKCGKEKCVCDDMNEGTIPADSHEWEPGFETGVGPVGDDNPFTKAVNESLTDTNDWEDGSFDASNHKKEGIAFADGGDECGNGVVATGQKNSGEVISDDNLSEGKDEESKDEGSEDEILGGLKRVFGKGAQAVGNAAQKVANKVGDTAKKVGQTVGNAYNTVKQEYQAGQAIEQQNKAKKQAWDLYQKAVAANKEYKEFIKANPGSEPKQAKGEGGKFGAMQAGEQQSVVNSPAPQLQPAIAESKEVEKDVIAEERDRFFNIINRIEKLYD